MPAASAAPAARACFVAYRRTAHQYPCRTSGCVWAEPTVSCRAASALSTCATLNPRTSGCSISPRTRPRQLTHFSDRGFLNTFDVTPDGKYLVFDRTRQNSDIVLIDLPAK